MGNNAKDNQKHVRETVKKNLSQAEQDKIADEARQIAQARREMKGL